MSRWPSQRKRGLGHRWMSRKARPSMQRPGQRDYSTARLTRHALERFVERFGAGPSEADAAAALRAALRRTRRLGRNPETGAVAVLAVHRGRALIAVLQDASCLTVLTWPQFEPRLPEFGRPHPPRKWGRLLRRLTDPLPSLDPHVDPPRVTEDPLSDTDDPSSPPCPNKST